MNNGSYAVAEDGESNRVSPETIQDRSFSSGDSASFASHETRPGPIGVAGRLLAARQALGLSAEDVAVRTRVTLRHIEALEAGDFRAMPGRPYAIGFARAYARAVGLNDIEIAEAVRSELQGSAPRPEARVVHQFEVGDPAKTPSRLIGWLAMLMVGAILAMGGVFWRSYYAPAVSLPSLVGESERPAAVRTPKRAGVQPPASPRPDLAGPVVFTALEEGVWVKFYDQQGKQLMQKQLAKGESYTVPEDAVGPKLWTGRPDALSITIGGQAIPRLAAVEKVIKDVPVDAVSLRGQRLSAGEAPSAQNMPVVPKAD